MRAGPDPLSVSPRLARAAAQGWHFARISAKYRHRTDTVDEALCAAAMYVIQGGFDHFTSSSAHRQMAEEPQPPLAFVSTCRRPSIVTGGA